MSVFNQEELRVFNAVRAAASSRLRKNSSDAFGKSLLATVKQIDRLEGLLLVIDALQKRDKVSAAASRGVLSLRQQLENIQQSDDAHARAIARRGQSAD